jgi:predicted transposase/invertase (TIGR01784 family)
MANLKYELTRDTLFKLFFVQYQDLLKNLVSQVLNISVADITAFKINNPNITPKELGGKHCVLDIVMEVNNKLVNLEVQVEDEKDYPARSLFYWARSYSNALFEGDKNYNALPPTVAINIVKFELFKDTEDFHSEFRALEVKRHTELTDKMALHYFELKKLPEVTESDAGNVLKLWLALFNAETDEEMAKIAKIGGEIMEQAVVAYKNVVASKKFRNAERLRERARLDELAALHHARTEGRAEGRTEGMEQEREEIIKLIEQGQTIDEIKKILTQK